MLASVYNLSANLPIKLDEFNGMPGMGGISNCFFHEFQRLEPNKARRQG